MHGRGLALLHHFILCCQQLGQFGVFGKAFLHRHVTNEILGPFPCLEEMLAVVILNVHIGDGGSRACTFAAPIVVVVMVVLIATFVLVLVLIVLFVWLEEQIAALKIRDVCSTRGGRR